MTLPLQDIPVLQIIDPAWNSRTSSDAEADATLAASIKRDGVSTPVKVQQTGEAGVYQLIYGSRRLKAARTAGLATIPALVAPAPPEGAGDSYRLEQMLENARENLARRDLTPYEQARTFAELRKAGLKLRDVASRTGVTEGYVSNLAIIYTQADPRIITEWAKGNPAATTGFLRQLVADEKDGSKQLAIFQERVAQLSAPAEGGDEVEDEDEDEDEDEKSKKNAPADKYHVEKARYTKLLRALTKVKAPSIAANAVKYLVGTLTRIPSVIQDEKEKEES